MAKRRGAAAVAVSVVAILANGPAAGAASTSASGGSPPPAGWAKDAGYQQLVSVYASELATHGVNISLTLNAGTEDGYTGSALAQLLVTNAQGKPDTDPLTNCWISVGADGQEPSNLEATKEALAIAVFNCYAAGIDGTAYKTIAPWALDGGAAWVACQLVSQPKTMMGFEGEYLATPSRPLFARSYDAIGFFNLIAQTTGLPGSRWHKIIASALTANVPAYANAVGSSAEEEQILSAWAAQYAQDSGRGSDWNVDAQWCRPPETDPAPSEPLAVANGSQAKLSTDKWTVSLVSPKSSADVVEIDPSRGHIRLSSGALDRELSGPAAFCTRSHGDCRCPGSSQTLPRISANGGTLIALTGGPTGAEATVTGDSLKKFFGDFCKRGASTGSCRVTALQVASILRLGNAAVLDKPVYTSETEAGLNYGCELGAWTGSKPTSGPQTLQEAMGGAAGLVASESWVPNGGPNADKWPAEFKELAKAFEKGTFPNLYSPGLAAKFSPASYGYEAAGRTTKLGPPLVGLVFAGACWWNVDTLTATCLGDWEANGSNVVAHLNALAAIAIPHSLG